MQQHTAEVALAVDAFDGIHAALTRRAAEVEHARVALALLVHLALQQAPQTALSTPAASMFHASESARSFEPQFFCWRMQSPKVCSVGGCGLVVYHLRQNKKESEDAATSKAQPGGNGDR